MKKFFKEFKKFIAKGNILDMAIGIIIGSAFSAIITSLVNSILYPLLSLLGGNDMSAWVTVLKQATYAEDGITVLAKAVVIDWGAFVSAVINFLLIAFVLFMFLKIYNTAKKSIDLKEKIQTKLDNDIKLTDFEEKLLAKWLKKDAESAPKKKAAPEKPKQTPTEILLEQILEELKNKENSKVLTKKPVAN